MITYIVHFWKKFDLIENELLDSLASNDISNENLRFLEKPLKKIHKDLSLIVEYRPLDPPQLYFIARGKLSLKKLISEILRFAPFNSQWQFNIGIAPWDGSLAQLCLRYRFFGRDTEVYEVYFDIARIHKTTRKMDLVLYIEKNRRIPKYLVNENAKTLLIFYLGDTAYYKNIARIKIAMKRFKTFNFAPLSQLKRVLDFALT